MIEERVTSDLSGKRSPTALTTQFFRCRGFECDIVERRITPIVKRDLFGFADHLAFMSPQVLTFAQSTSASNHSARVKKIAENEIARLLVQGGQCVCVISWKRKKARKIKKDGTPGKQFMYVHEGRVSTFQVEDFTC